MAVLKDVVAFLDRELRLAAFEDSSHNGLQVENAGQVTRIACGVDASQEFFEAARRCGADFVFCHHGLSWGDSLKRITQLNYRRLAFLIRNGMALYACHLPLDAHPRLGNNALICRALRLRQLRPIGTYHGQKIGFLGRLPAAISRAAFKKLTARVIGPRLTTLDFGPQTIRTVAVISGAAGDLLNQVAEAGPDVYLTGEPMLPAYNSAREFGLNVVFAGHYATEVFGVRAVGELLHRRFKLPVDFIRLDVPF